MIVLWILAALIALVVLVLFSSLTLRVRWDKSLKVTVRFWFVRVNLLRFLDRDGSEQKKKIKKEKKPKTARNAPAEKKKRSLKEFLDFLAFLTRLLAQALKELVSRLKLRIRKLEITVAHEEPDRTAILYGLTCPVVYQLCETVGRFTKSTVDYRKIAVHSDFTAKSFSAELDLACSLRVIDLLAVLAKVLVLLQQIKTHSGGMENERNSVETSH